jgi:redox-sensitive bicupin YhaK (pirin superfamily)
MNAVLRRQAMPRAIVHRTRGDTHGPITRLVSPPDLGELIKPFVFLDLFQISPSGEPLFGWHPHSGIATLTLIHGGATTYEETTGRKGLLNAGSVEWMRAGRGVWHTGTTVGPEVTSGFQLWVALPENLELAPSQSQYLSAGEVPAVGKARVILGSYQDATSVIEAPPGINYLDLKLEAGQSFHYQPPAGHQVSWLALSHGAVQVGESVSAGELVIFEESESGIEIQAKSLSRLVLGSAVKHPHPLVLGRHSVHTTSEALRAGKREIIRLGSELMAAGTIRQI